MKKRFLELLIRQAGLTPIDISHYKTDSCGGQYEVSTGWKGAGVDSEGRFIVNFETPEGFNDAVCEVMSQIYDNCDIIFKTDRDFKV